MPVPKIVQPAILLLEDPRDACQPKDFLYLSRSRRVEGVEPAADFLDRVEMVPRENLPALVAHLFDLVIRMVIAEIVKLLVARFCLRRFRNEDRAGSMTDQRV
jgi:hypothetical protein